MLKPLAAMGCHSAGSYTICGCGSRPDPIIVLLGSLWSTLQTVLSDSSGESSSKAYTAFFKNIAYAEAVHAIFADIANGTSVPPSPNEGLPPKAPVIVCPTHTEQFTFSIPLETDHMDGYTYCRMAQNKNVAAFFIPGSNIIALCPYFFTLAAVPAVSSRSCLTVNPHFRRFDQDGRRMLMFQLWAILHELAHYYIYASNGAMVDFYDVNSCLILAPSEAVKNAQNFVYYAASKHSAPGHFEWDVFLIGIFRKL